MALAAIVVVAPRTASANASRFYWFGDLPAAVAPNDVTTVRIDRETLVFELEPSRASAEVTARYHLVETGAGSELDLAFAYVAGEFPAKLAPAVTLDGAPVSIAEAREESLVKPRLDAWLDVHDDIAKTLAELHTLADDAQRPLQESVALRVKALGGECGGRCDLLRDYVESHGDLARVMGAAREAMPDFVRSIEVDWRGDDAPPTGALRFALFHVAVGASEKKTLEVRYLQTASQDRRRRVHESYDYEYLLVPARRWQSFGVLDVEVRVPERTLVDADPPLRREGNLFHGSFPGIPANRFLLDVRSSEGLWFGLETPDRYWNIVAAVAALATILASSWLGRRWAAVRTAWIRGLLHVLVSSGIGVAAAILALFVLAIGMPSRALGDAYAEIFGTIALSFGAAPLGALASLVACMIQRRRAPMSRASR